ncbi:MAG: hypothetical protein ABI678_27130, partial [Kofleriaceae bacterium]
RDIARTGNITCEGDTVDPPQTTHVKLAAMKHVVLGALATVVLVSCQSGNMMPRETTMEPVPTASGPPPPLTDDPSTRIDKLYADLVARRSALSLRTPPQRPVATCEPVCAIEDPPDKPSRTAGCAPGAGSACTTTCAQADGACEDAAQICSIAKELQTAAWAADRCHDARATCTDARAPCCECKSP